ncbi:MAG: hypothetical protein AAFP28_04460 [Pseudomonadota bacterium]
MSLGVFLAILFAAALHASWNAIVKGGADKTLAMGAVVLGHVPIALIAIFFVPFPSAETWPYIAAGVALHMGYQLFLIQSYRHGDLTQVYPIARGVAPLIVTVISLLVLGVALSGWQVAGGGGELHCSGHHRSGPPAERGRGAQSEGGFLCLGHWRLHCLILPDRRDGRARG